MKKIYLALLILSFLLGSCAVLSPAEPTATPMPPTPTPVPDPCSPENIVSETEELQALVNSFQDAMNIANNTDVSLLIHPILRLQEIQKEIRAVGVPVCLQTLKGKSIDYTISVVNYLLIFMNTQDPASEDLNAAIQGSQALWQSVLAEFNTVLTSAGLAPQEIPELSEALPETEGTGATVINEGTSAVNLRSAPNTDAAVVASLETGASATALGKNEAGDWIQVDLNGTLGWVFAENITLNVAIEELQIIDVTP